MAKIIFVTGTDTGVGKTLLTSVLLSYLTERGVRAFAMKPFCSGGRQDARLFHELQERLIPLDVINPYHFDEPLAPFVAGSRTGVSITKGEVIGRIRELEQVCDVLLVEGCGGLLAPLGPGYSLADLISTTRAAVIVAAANRLGALNHTLLTLNVLRAERSSVSAVVLMGTRRPSLAARTNPRVLAELIAPIRLLDFGYLGSKVHVIRQMRGILRRRKKVLAELLRIVIVTPTFAAGAVRRAGRKTG